MGMCVMCGNPIEPYSCSRKRCTNCIGLKRTKGVYAPCAYCGRTALLTRDHIVPKSRGGTSEKDNIILVCRCCNESKGNLLLEEWLFKINGTPMII